MRFLAFGDIHGDWHRLDILLSSSVDVFVSTGDVTRASRDEFVEFMRRCGNKRCLTVPGNNELPEWVPNYMNIHGEKKALMGITFGGIGGSPHTPFNTLFEWEEDYAYRILEKLGYVDVLVSHTPPKGTTLSFTRSGVDAGSEAVLWYIEEYAPLLALVGHIHEREGYSQRLGGTLIINPGKRGAIFEIKEGDAHYTWL